MENKGNAELYLMLGEIRGDLKYLVNARKLTDAKMEALDTTLTDAVKDTDIRLTDLETFRTKIATLTTALGIGVPTLLTVTVKQLGLM